LDLLLMAQGLLPLSLQGPCYQAIFRLDCPILPGRPLGLIVCAFSPLMPMCLELLALGT
jgi:hypothetical protein